MHVELPQAAPDVYLRWVARWRDVDRAARHGGPGPLRRRPPALLGLVSEFLGTTLVPQVQTAAWDARRDGLAYVAPTIDGDEELLRLSVEALARRGRWLEWAAEQERVAAVAGLAPPEVELRMLHHRMVERLRGQLYGEPKDRDLIPAGSAFCPSCGSTDVMVLATTVHGAGLSITACNDCDGSPWAAGVADQDTVEMVTSTGVRPEAS